MKLKIILIWLFLHFKTQLMHKNILEIPTDLFRDRKSKGIALHLQDGNKLIVYKYRNNCNGVT